MEDMQDKIENLDDDFAAIDNIVRRVGSSKGGKSDGLVEGAEREMAATKFSKSLKQFVKPKQAKHVNFAELKTKDVVGDSLYEG